jgi:hypothetical protein
VSNRDCVGVQWINPCINGSGGAVGVALWTVNPNGVSGSIPLMNESETERKKMQVKRDENQIVGLFPKSGGSRLPVPRGGRLRFESFSIG